MHSPILPVALGGDHLAEVVVAVGPIAAVFGFDSGALIGVIVSVVKRLIKVAVFLEATGADVRQSAKIVELTRGLGDRFASGFESGAYQGTGLVVVAVVGGAVVLAHGSHAASIVVAVVVDDVLLVRQASSELSAPSLVVELLFENGAVQRAATDQLADQCAFVTVFLEVGGTAVHDVAVSDFSNIP